jgi:KEOPS complex subunit Cgi121
MEISENYTMDIISGQIQIDNVNTFMDKLQTFSSSDITVQAFNAKMIFGKQHLFSAVHHTIRAKNQNRLITHSLSMELLLYASGERQLKHAIPKMGVTEDMKSIVILIMYLRKHCHDIKEKLLKMLTHSYSFTEDPRVLNSDVQSLHLFGITDEELQTIPKDKYQDLILEKVALVDIIK